MVKAQWLPLLLVGERKTRRYLFVEAEEEERQPLLLAELGQQLPMSRTYRHTLTAPQPSVSFGAMRPRVEVEEQFPASHHPQRPSTA